MGVRVECVPERSGEPSAMLEQSIIRPIVCGETKGHARAATDVRDSPDQVALG